MPACDAQHLAVILDRFGARAADARLLGRSQNDVYACHIDSEPSVIRISVDRHRTIAQIEAELAWIRDCARHGVPVCSPRPSCRGQWCERITLDGKTYLAVRFERAPGRKVLHSDIGPALYRELGKLTAQLHSVALDAADAASYAAARPYWHQSRLLNQDLLHYTPPDAEPFRQSVQRLVADLQHAPVTPDDNGLIHADISFSNTFTDAGRLCIFDFDNCERGWIAQDFATVLYDSIYCKLVNHLPPAALNDRVRTAWLWFQDGYTTIRTPPRISPARLTLFTLLREAIIYIHYCRILNPASLTPAQLVGIDQMRRNVEQGVSPINIDGA